jgi:CubicO group peptidase (beta-lactamase class C family)
MGSTMMLLNRRHFILTLGSIVLSSTRRSARGAAPDAWATILPAEAGLDPQLGARLDEAVRKGALHNLHAVLVARAGRLAVERYYEGRDERWGMPLGTVKFDPEVKHDLRSISKSVVGLLYGIALAEGKVPPPDQPLVDQFPAYKDLMTDPQRRRLTVAHALSMTLGTEWNEDLPYTDPRNGEHAMELAHDRYRFVLDRPLVAEPGSRWNYNGGATALLGHLIARGVGKPLLDYAREVLFDPLGIRDAEWTPGTNGEAAAASGLRMRPRDLATLGQLVLDRGRWGEQQVVPADWLDQSFTPHAHVEEGIDYGYQWWLGRLRENGRPWVAGFGNGGQRLVVVPELRLVIVIMAGNYNRPDQSEMPFAVLHKFVLPALKDG